MLRRLWGGRGERGDTLIEVLFAITVLSLVIVLSLSIMNQGTAASLRSLQITLARQEIDSQAEALRFLNSAYVAAYTPGYTPDTSDATTSAAEEYYKILRDIAARGATSVSAFGNEVTAIECTNAPTGSFVLNARQGRYVPYSATTLVRAVTYPEVIYGSSSNVTASRGLWIEAVRSAASSGSRYVDFHIRACWSAPGNGVPMNLGTIVRLYEPAQ